MFDLSLLLSDVIRKDIDCFSTSVMSGYIEESTIPMVLMPPYILSCSKLYKLIKILPCFY